MKCVWYKSLPLGILIFLGTGLLLFGSAIYFANKHTPELLEDGAGPAPGSSEISGRKGSPPGQIGGAETHQYGHGAQLPSTFEGPDDFRKLVQILQSQGVSPDIIRFALLGAIDAYQRERLEKIYRDPLTGRVIPSNHQPTVAMQKARQELYIERSNILMEVLGRDGYESQQQRERRLGNISDDSYAIIIPLNQERSRRRLALRGEDLAPEERAARETLLELEHLQTLEDLLPPSDLLEYEVRQTFHGLRVGNAIREAKIDVSDEQLRQLLDLERLQPLIRSNQGTVEESLQQWQFQAEARPLLGDEKFKLFLQARDSSFRRMAQSIENIGMSLASKQILDLWELNGAQAVAIGKLQSVSGLSPIERMVQYESMLRQSQNKVEQIAGEEFWVLAHELEALPWVRTLESELMIGPSR